MVGFNDLERHMLTNGFISTTEKEMLFPKHNLRSSLAENVIVQNGAGGKENSDPTGNDSGGDIKVHLGSGGGKSTAHRQRFGVDQRVVLRKNKVGSFGECISFFFFFSLFFLLQFR